MTAITNYLSPDRHYHNFTHIFHMIDGLKKYFPGYDDIVLGNAILYHDVIYNVGSKTNERDSADVAVRELEDKFTDYALCEIYRLIMLTRCHETVYDDERGKIIIDLDLAGLAGSNYQDNSIALRKEFHTLSDEEWREGRIYWLNNFLDRQQIYYTEYGKKNWEEKARINLEAELDYLVGLNA